MLTALTRRSVVPRCFAVVQMHAVCAPHSQPRLVSASLLDLAWIPSRKKIFVQAVVAIAVCLSFFGGLPPRRLLAASGGGRMGGSTSRRSSTSSSGRSSTSASGTRSSRTPYVPRSTGVKTSSSEGTKETARSARDSTSASSGPARSETGGTLAGGSLRNSLSGGRIAGVTSARSVREESRRSRLSSVGVGSITRGSWMLWGRRQYAPTQGQRGADDSTFPESSFADNDIDSWPERTKSDAVSWRTQLGICTMVLWWVLSS